MLHNRTVSVSGDKATGDDIVDFLGHNKGSSALGQTMENVAGSHAKHQWPQRGNEEKVTAVHEEMQRMNQLPPNSSYVTHRLRVLKKVLQLLSTQRTVSQEEELELLFASLHL